MSAFGNALREFRRQHVGTLQQMSERTKVSLVKLSELERGVCPITHEDESMFARVVVGVYAGIYDSRPVVSLGDALDDVKQKEPKR